MTQENWFIIFIIMCIFYAPGVVGTGIVTIVELTQLHILNTIIFGLLTGVMAIPMLLVYRKAFA